MEQPNDLNRSSVGTQAFSVPHLRESIFAYHYQVGHCLMDAWSWPAIERARWFSFVAGDAARHSSA